MELWKRTALELGRLIARREVRAVEVVTHFLERIEALNPAINAVVTLDADGALAAARMVDERLDRGETFGPLAGVPVTIKDLTETKGLRTTYGSALLRDHVPDVDAVLVERLRRAGLPILGKTNTPEFGGKFDTENRLFGATRNPWKLDHSPGGSSGGAAAQVAAGLG
ncbi:amidase, partial [Rhodothermus marinus]